jgi:hypothetical protein
MKITTILRNLPENILWKILTEFMGSHVVRTGRLIKKLDLNKYNYKNLMSIPPIVSGSIYRNMSCVAMVWFSNGGHKMYCEDSSGEMKYLTRFRRIKYNSRDNGGKWQNINYTIIVRGRLIID